jgi:RNA polymerase sigma-70 factor, ECF subfamily
MAAVNHRLSSPLGGCCAMHMAGDESEFVSLLTRHSSRIYGFILLLSVGHADAEDIFQDTSVVLWEKFSSYTPGTNFQAWACRIAYYETLRRRREQPKTQYFSDEALRLLSNDALIIMEQPELDKEALSECLDKLADKDRRLIEQKYFIRLSTAEIAKNNSRPVHTIYRELGRIHTALLRCVRKALESA